MKNMFVNYANVTGGVGVKLARAMVRQYRKGAYTNKSILREVTV